jgi:hypothetical protein
MQINHPSTSPDFYTVSGGNIRSGKRDGRLLLTGRDGAVDNYKFQLTSVIASDDDVTLPRHHHAFDQVRYVLEGDWSIAGEKRLEPGWVGYFPESCHYGPQFVRPNVKMLILQFGGASGQGYYTIEERKKAFATLQERGRFQNGMYVYTDDDGVEHRQDSAEAVWEQTYGSLSYPPKRYDDLILMNPANYSWIGGAGQPGVWRKMLGAFTEREIKLGLVRLDPGASLSFGTEPSVEILFLLRGAVLLDETKHPEQTAFGTTAEDEPVTLVAAEETECFYAKLPTWTGITARD